MLLSRITTPGKQWIPEIDGLRFFAISSVLLIHIFNQLMNSSNPLRNVPPGRNAIMLMEHLGRGVELFFAISGFILAQPFLRQFQDGGEPVRLRYFYMRRVTRLEPPYVLSLAIYAAALVATHHHKLRAVLYGLLSSISYVHNLFPLLVNINPPTWSLEVEIEFYLIAPLLATIYLIRHRETRLAVHGVLIVLFAIVPHVAADKAGFLLLSNLCYFLVGYLLADLRVHRITSLSSAAWDLVSLTLWPAFFFLIPDYHNALLLCISLFLCFTASMLGPLTRKLIGTRWIALTGGMCYSFYLMHMLILSAIYPITRRLAIFGSFWMNYLVELCLLLPVIVAGGTIYFILIERPCMNPSWPQKALAFFKGDREAVSG